MKNRNASLCIEYRIYISIYIVYNTLIKLGDFNKNKKKHESFLSRCNYIGILLI